MYTLRHGVTSYYMHWAEWIRWYVSCCHCVVSLQNSILDMPPFKVVTSLQVLCHTQRKQIIKTFTPAQTCSAYLLQTLTERTVCINSSWIILYLAQWQHEGNVNTEFQVVLQGYIFFSVYVMTLWLHSLSWQLVASFSRRYVAQRWVVQQKSEFDLGE